MSIFGKAMKAGVAKKAMNEAKKPQNQAKIKGLVSKFTGGKSGGTGTRKPRSTGRR